MSRDTAIATAYRAAAQELRRLLSTVPDDAAQAMAAASYSLEHAAQTVEHIEALCVDPSTLMMDEPDERLAQFSFADWARRFSQPSPPVNTGKSLIVQQFRPFHLTPRQAAFEQAGLQWAMTDHSGRTVLNINAIKAYGCGYHGPLGYIKPIEANFVLEEAANTAANTSDGAILRKKPTKKNMKNPPQQGHVVKGNLGSAIQRGSNL